MALIKNIFKFLFILIGIAILVVLTGVAVMMIGKVTIFGYKFVNYEEVITVRSAVSSASDIAIDTNGVAVEIVSSNDVSSIEYKLTARIQGVYKANTILDSEKPVNYKAEVESNVLNIKTLEPAGVNFIQDSKLTIWVPASMNIGNLVIKTGTNKIGFGNTTTINLKKLNIEMTSNLREFTISNKVNILEQFDIKTSSGRVYVNAAIAGDVNINSKLGTFIFSQDVGSGSSTINIAGGSPAVEFGHMKNNNFASDVEKTVNINGDLVVECETGGLVEIAGQITGKACLISPNVELRARELVGELVATDGFASIVLDKLAGASNINKKDGYLYIKQVTSPSLSITGLKNKIVIDELTNCQLDITNAYGDVQIKSLGAGKATINTTNGSMYINGIQNTVNLIGQKGSINAEFISVVGDNVITNERKVSVKVVDNNKFNLTTKSKTGRVNVNLGSVQYNNWDEAEETEGYKSITKTVNGEASNYVSITTEGGDILAAILTA